MIQPSTTPLRFDLDNGPVLSITAPKELDINMRAAGFQVYDPDMTMFLQAGGGAHCMCQP